MYTQKFSHDRYVKLVHDTFEKVMQLSKLKGGEYSGDDDRLLNFRRNGTALSLHKETIWAVYAAKHWDALMQYIKDQEAGKDRQRLESLEGRCDDLIVYLCLFKAMLIESQEPMVQYTNGTTPAKPDLSPAKTDGEPWLGKMTISVGGTRDLGTMLSDHETVAARVALHGKYGV